MTDSEASGPREQDQSPAAPPVNVPRSHAPGVFWPAVPDWRQAAVLALLQQLERSQWWAPDEIERLQLMQAGRLVLHAYKSVPWYRERLAKISLSPDGRIRPEVWRSMPLLRRQDLQAHAGSLRSEAVPEGHGEVQSINSSGSTGRPITAQRTQLSMLFWEAFTHREHDWHGRDRRETLAVMRHAGEGEDPYPDGTRAPNWGSYRRGVFETGPCFALNLNCSPAQQAEWLQRRAPAYLLTFPTTAERLARHCLETGERIPSLRQVQLIAELVRPDLRDLIREAWNAATVSNYSAREAGYLALQCPEHDHMHVQSEGVILEVLREDGEPCAPGETGRVVVTPLHNFAMPLIRYDVGDYAELGGPCPCGRGLPVLKRVLGREQTVFKLPDGGHRWTLMSSGDIGQLLGLAPIRRYQFVQTAPDQVRARLVVARALTAQEEERVKEWLCNKLQYPFRVELEYPQDLPLTAGGKFFDFISEVT